MNNKKIITQLNELKRWFINKYGTDFEEKTKCVDDAVNILERYDRGVVGIGAYEQVRWERDMALSQLEELGYHFGEKIRPIDRRKFEEKFNIDVYRDLVEAGILREEDGCGYYTNEEGCVLKSDFDPEKIELMKNLGAAYVYWNRK